MALCRSFTNTATPIAESFLRDVSRREDIKIAKASISYGCRNMACVKLRRALNQKNRHMQYLNQTR
ncbi:hypothetical protein DCAR_0832455 [Daucus carota subsp. sativus]|uniref:Uncharacterized protein n=1 Tax=Daucus carota subsp. sativus TaxID=79200 RepID=A0A175YPC9_DAUCS|nr:hypothetical protein DCAR_0832455 [Daucus carota subsp. sativus]